MSRLQELIVSKLKQSADVLNKGHFVDPRDFKSIANNVAKEYTLSLEDLAVAWHKGEKCRIACTDGDESFLLVFENETIDMQWANSKEVTYD